MNNSTNIIISLVSIILSGFLTFINLSEWYIVKILEQTSSYPFGGEGPKPYYYKTTELYSTVSFVWGLIFLIALLISIWIITKKRKTLTLKSFGIILFLTICMFIHGQI